MPSRWMCALIGGVVAAHAALFIFALVEPDAMLEFDRAKGRLAGAQALAGASSAAELVAVTAARPALGDYGWHGLVLRVFGDWLPAVQLVRLALLALSMCVLHAMVGHLGGSRSVRWTAVLLYALIPIDFMLPHLVASEAFFNPLVVIGSFFLVRYSLRSFSARDCALAGVAFSLAAVTRPEILAWIPVMFTFMAIVAARCVPTRTLAHLALLIALTSSLPALWLGFRGATTGELAFGGSRQTLAFELDQRRRAIEAAVGLPSPAGANEPPDREGSALMAYLSTSAEHPVAFAHEWALHTGKLIFLPDNLDGFRYLGLFEFTGQRSSLVHSQGVLGALRSLFGEMPGLMTWLLVTVALFGVVWVFAARGALLALQRSTAMARLVSLLLLSLPAVYVGLRVLTQGESRKRSPVDFVLAIFAAFGLWGQAPRSRDAGSIPTAALD